jgi:hypothetical protein
MSSAARYACRCAVSISIAASATWSWNATESACVVEKVYEIGFVAPFSMTMSSAFRPRPS